MSTFPFGKIKGWHGCLLSSSCSRSLSSLQKVSLILKGLIDKTQTEKLGGTGQRERRRKGKNKEAGKEREERAGPGGEAEGSWMCDGRRLATGSWDNRGVLFLKNQGEIFTQNPKNIALCSMLGNDNVFHSLTHEFSAWCLLLESLAFLSWVF